ncbi:MAG TPA: matrixin family metalloprotease [Drouetiella sp.]
MPLQRCSAIRRKILILGLATLSGLFQPSLAIPGDYQAESKVYDALTRAHDLIAADRYNEARPLLESVAKYDPTRYSGSLHENLAIIYRELGNPERAVSQARLAQSFGCSPGVSYTLGLCYSDMGDFTEAESWLQRFILDSPDAQFRQQAQDVLRDLQDDSNKVKSGGSKKRDYFEDITHNHEAQMWKQSQMPLKVYVDSGKGVKNFRPTYKRLILEALDQWCSASGNKLSYKMVPDKKSADIDVEWVGQSIETIQKDRKRDAAGLTTTATDDKAMISHALVQIDTYDFDHNRQVADSKIKSVCLHEIGHALGVGHSPYVKDIMYFKITPRQLISLSPRDRATAAKLYVDYPVVTLVTGTSSLPPECFAQPSLPPGVMRYPPIPQSLFAQPTLPPQQKAQSGSTITTVKTVVTVKTTTPPGQMKVSTPASLFAQPSLPPGGKRTTSQSTTSSNSNSTSQLFATPSLPTKH